MAIPINHNHHGVVSINIWCWNWMIHARDIYVLFTAISHTHARSQNDEEQNEHDAHKAINADPGDRAGGVAAFFYRLHNIGLVIGR